MFHRWVQKSYYALNPYITLAESLGRSIRTSRFGGGMWVRIEFAGETVDLNGSAGNRDLSWPAF